MDITLFATGSFFPPQMIRLQQQRISDTFSQRSHLPFASAELPLLTKLLINERDGANDMCMLMRLA